MWRMTLEVGAARAILVVGLWMIGKSQGTSAVFRSDDRGEIWRSTGAELPTDARINAVSIQTNLYLAGTDEGLFVSENEGVEWSRSISEAARTRITSFGETEGLIAAGTDHGILLSADGGRDWAKTAAFPTVKVRCIASWSGALAVGTDANGVLTSWDGGTSWRALTNGLPAGAQIFAMAVVGQELFSGLYRQGLFRWMEKDQIWRKTGDVRPLALAAAGGTLIVGHNPGGLFWSDDLGKTWHRPGDRETFGSALLDSVEVAGDPVGEAPVWELHGGERLFVVGAGDGLFISRDLGRSWERALKGLPSGATGISFASSQDTILAGISISRRKN